MQSIQSVWIHSIDSAGKRHGFSDVEPKQFLEIFVEDRPDYGLFQVVEVHDYTDGAGDYLIVDVSFVQSLENTTRLNDDDLCRLKIFEAPSGGDAGGFVKKTGDTMSGNLIIDKSTESTDAEAGLALTGSRSSTTNSAATISFENDQSSTPGYLTYRSYATSHYFKFNQDVDLNNNGLHSVAQIRMQNDGYIGSGANQRIKIRTGGSSVNQAGTEIQRVGDDKRAFAIRGKAAGSSSITDFFWAYGNGGTGGDAINYTGKMTSNDNIVNKGYVDSKMPTYKITKSNGNYYVE